MPNNAQWKILQQERRERLEKEREKLQKEKEERAVVEEQQEGMDDAADEEITFTDYKPSK